MKKAEAATSIPKLLNYQARVTDDAGVAVPDGNLNIWISVYDAPSGGSCLYAMRGSCGSPSYKTVTVSSGVFSMLIGDTASGDAEIPDDLFDRNALYLGVTVASDTEMVPRKRISASPYAFNADRLDDLDLASSGSTTPYVVGTTANGNLVITGDPQGGLVSNGSVYVNPASASASETLFGIADNGTNRWMIDKEGDVTHSGSLLATAASSTAQFVFRAAASQSNNVFEVQGSTGLRALGVSATGTQVMGGKTLTYDSVNGKLGINSLDPNFDDWDGSSAIWVQGQGATEAVGISLYSAHATGLSPAIFNFMASRGTVSSYQEVENGDRLGVINFAGLDDADTMQYSASIMSTVDGGTFAGGVPAQLQFRTGTSGANKTTRLIVDSNGLVTVGDTGGAARLTVSGSGTSPVSNVFEVANGSFGQKYLTVSSTNTLLGATQSGYRLGVRTAAPTTTLTVGGDSFLSGHVIMGDQFTLGTSTPNGSYIFDLGENTTADGSVGINVNITHSPSGSGHIAEGQFVNVETSSGNSTAIDQLAAYDGQSLLNGSGTANTLWGVLAKAVNNSSGAVTFGIGMGGFPAITGSGQITHGIGFYAQGPTLTGTGSIQNLYGLYVEPMTRGAVSNYAVYYNNGVNGFFVRGTGDTGIGASNPNARLTVAASTTSPTANLFAVQNVGTGANGLERYLTVSATNVAVGFASASTTRSLGVNWGVSTNLTPLTDATYDLGEYNRRWRDLWLSGGSANIAYDASGTTVMQIGWKDTEGRRARFYSSGQAIQISPLGGARSGLTIEADGEAVSSNFHDYVRDTNVNLGGVNGRGVVAGYSGGSYSGIGYNIQHTGTSNTYLAAQTDAASYLRFTLGGFEFLSDSSNTAGDTLAFSTLATLNSSGQLGIGIVPESGTHVVQLNGGGDVDVGTSGSGYLTIGDVGTEHLVLDNNEIMAKATGTTGSVLNLNVGSGFVSVGGVSPGQELDVAGDIRFDANGTATTNGLCHSGADSDTTFTNRDIVACSGAPADIAEFMPFVGSATSGDIVSLTDETFTYQSDRVDPFTGEINPDDKDTLTIARAQRSQSQYDSRVVGIVSTSPAQVYGRGVLSVAGHDALPVAITGRVPARVNLEGGSIKAGDPITSSSVTGVGMKSTKPGMIVGYALDAWNGPGEGRILVLLDIGFHSGLAITTDGAKSLFNDDFAFLPPAYADEDIQAVASRELSFSGSAWDSASSTSVTRSITLGNVVTDMSDYQLAFKNDAGQVLASLNSVGDLAIAGTLSVEGGFDYAEMFPAVPDIEAGDIVMVDAENANGYGVKKTQTAYENSAIGVISTKPGFLTGDRKAEGAQPVALAGRVPVKVNLENGAILPGDPITSSSTPGVGMKATEAGRVIGIALQGASENGTVLIFVNPSWWNGPMPVGGLVASSGFTVTQDSLLDFKNSVLSNVAAVISTNGSWSVTSDGILAAKKVEAETVQAGDVILVQSEGKASAGEGVIKDGHTAAVIHNPAMKANSKVFVSFLGDPRGGSWVAEKGDGDFTVHLSQPALGDLAFEYWIVGVDDRRPAGEAPAEEAPAAPPEPDAPPNASASGTGETASASGTEALGG